MTTIHYVDSLAGSGKTYAAIREAHRLALLDKKVLIVQPTVTLIRQTKADLRTLAPSVPITAIYGDGAHGPGTSEQVGVDIMRHFKEAVAGGEIVLITHAAFLSLRYVHRPEDWHVIVDEIPQADWVHEVQFKRANDHKIVTEHLDLATDQYAGAGYPRLVPARRHLNPLKEMHRNKANVPEYAAIRDLLTKVLALHWNVHVLESQYCSLLDGKSDGLRLLAFAILSPALLDGYASATIMGACFKESTLYHLWRMQGVEFRPHTKIQSRLRYAQHSNCDLLTIRYVVDQGWSKRLRDEAVLTSEVTAAEEGAEAKRLLDHVVEAITTAFDGRPFAWMGNTDQPDDLFGGLAVRLPNSPHGLNEFQHIHNVAVVSALNPPPAHFAFLRSLGLSSEEVKQAGYWQSVYQAVMRGSLRDPDDRAKKTVIVMDRPTADWLAGLFPSCRLERLDCAVKLPEVRKAGRPRKHVCDADRKAAYRDRCRRELTEALDAMKVQPADRVHGLPAELRESFDQCVRLREQGATTGSNAGLPAIGGSLFGSVFAATACAFMPLTSIDEFIGLLRWFHSLPHPAKDDNWLISPATFEAAAASKTKRGLANVREIWGIWFDNDGGDLTPDAFAALFPRLRMVIYNTYSSTNAAPRWRVFVPTTMSMPAAVFSAIINIITKTLNENGYWSDKQLADGRPRKDPQRHGFDMTKLVPTSLFYLPCQAKDTADSFFTDYNGKRRQPLDPYQWAEFAARAARPTPEPPATVVKLKPATSEDAVPTKSSEDSREAAIATWRCAAKGHGHNEFFKLACKLRGSGMPLDEVRATLQSEVSFARSPDDRRRQISGIMASLTTDRPELAA
ncbi:MAG: DEAD/DEAH box helicase family protein [Rhodospirillales bacterium]|nr:DEAD/DEAH box helicase family protein [Rhodospirillales bacterium]